MPPTPVRDASVINIAPSYLSISYLFYLLSSCLLLRANPRLAPPPDASPPTASAPRDRSTCRPRRRRPRCIGATVVFLVPPTMA